MPRTLRLAPDWRVTPLLRKDLPASTLALAPFLIGKLLIHASADGMAGGRIVETEAYRGPADRAAHSRGGHRSARNEVMYGPPGHAYVYFVYGMHHCVNVVTQAADVPEAVLIRALEPLAGIELMRTRRALADGPDSRLCRGPGALCRALGIDGTVNGADLVRGALRVLDAPEVAPSLVTRTPRIGVDYAGIDAARPWRFVLRESPAASGPRVRPTSSPIARARAGRRLR